jgi:hypothetical protein
MPLPFGHYHVHSSPEMPENFVKKIDPSYGTLLGCSRSDDRFPSIMSIEEKDLVCEGLCGSVANPIVTG